MSPKSKSRKKPAKRRIPASGRHRPAQGAQLTDEAPTAARYTPRKVLRIRPTWHKVLGVSILVLGLTIVAVNYYAEFNEDFIPGGHEEGYFLLGLVIAVTSTWWFGLFDKPM